MHRRPHDHSVHTCSSTCGRRFGGIAFEFARVDGDPASHPELAARAMRHRLQKIPESKHLLPEAWKMEVEEAAPVLWAGRLAVEAGHR